MRKKNYLGWCYLYCDFSVFLLHPHGPGLYLGNGSRCHADINRHRHLFAVVVVDVC